MHLKRVGENGSKKMRRVFGERLLNFICIVLKRCLVGCENEIISRQREESDAASLHLTLFFTIPFVH